MVKFNKAQCLLLCLFLLLLACKSTKNTSSDYLTPYEFEGKILSFGTGGGITGAVDQYTLMENGQLFRGAHKEGNVNVYKKLDKQLVTQMFNNFDNLGFAEMTMNNPGNQYYFIKMSDGEIQHKITWGGYGDERPEMLHLFYMNLYKLARKVSSSEDSRPATTK